MVVESAPCINAAAAHGMLVITDIVLGTVAREIVDGIGFGKESPPPEIELAVERQVGRRASPLALDPSVGRANDVVNPSIDVLKPGAELIRAPRIHHW